MLYGQSGKFPKKSLLNNLEISDRLNKYYPKKIDLSLGRIERLLEKLGHPQTNLPPVIHVAGTNGKGSVLAFIRAITEAAGLKVHVYTSPHLVKFNERIRVAGEVVSDVTLLSLLNECEAVNAGLPITFFELTTAMGFLAFARTPADLVLLETGLGGRLDATNVLCQPALTALTPISIDHVEFLGESITHIAEEKVAIMRSGVTSVVANQLPKVSEVITNAASTNCIPCQFQGKDWDYQFNNGEFNIKTKVRNSIFSRPILTGDHQLQNAAQAVACLDALEKFTFSKNQIEIGLLNTQWPGRLQRLTVGPLFEHLPSGWELWIDGGHNAAAGSILAKQAQTWGDKPLFAILGMIKTKSPGAFVASLRPYLKGIMTVEIAGQESTISSEELTSLLNENGLRATPASSIGVAIRKFLTLSREPARVLICGSLYLAGQVLRDHN